MVKYINKNDNVFNRFYPTLFGKDRFQPVFFYFPRILKLKFIFKLQFKIQATPLPFHEEMYILLTITFLEILNLQTQKC